MRSCCVHRRSLCTWCQQITDIQHLSWLAYNHTLVLTYWDFAVFAKPPPTKLYLHTIRYEGSTLFTVRCR